MAVKKKNWFKTGNEGWKTAKQEEKAAKERKAQQSGPRRFWMPNDSKRKVVFLDNPTFFMHEHNMKIGGKYNNFFTCIKEAGACPLCESGSNSSYVCVATVIDTNEYEYDGKKYKNQKRLIVFKGRARDKLFNQIERRKDLKYMVYELIRGSSNTECSTGEDFEYLGKVTAAKIKQLATGDDADDKVKFIKPFPYEELFAPKDEKTLREISGTSAPVGSEDDETGSADDDDLLGDGASEETGGGEFNEDEVVEALDGKTKVQVRKYSKEKNLDLDFKKLGDWELQDMIDEVVEAMREIAEAGGGGSEEAKDPDDLDIDDLI